MPANPPFSRSSKWLPDATSVVAPIRFAEEHRRGAFGQKLTSSPFCGPWRQPGFAHHDLDGVLLRRTGRAATFGDLLFEKGLELCGGFRFRRDEVVLLGDVGAEIVELARGAAAGA